jgi:hypothetical protein
LACVVSGSGKGETGKYGNPLLPKRLPIPVSVFFGAMLVLGGVYLCFRAFDVAGTGYFMRADLFICSGWILLDSGEILIFVAFGDLVMPRFLLFCFGAGGSSMRRFIILSNPSAFTLSFSSKPYLSCSCITRARGGALMHED